jgi:hypothetical protein
MTQGLHHMIRETSIEAYHKIRDCGLLSKLRFDVYDVVFKHGPLTQGEAWHEHLTRYQQHSVLPRFKELEDRGVIRCLGNKPCRTTGHNARVYDVTNNVPIDIDKKKSKDQIIRELRCEIIDLKKQVENLMTNPQMRMFHESK